MAGGPRDRLLDSDEERQERQALGQDDGFNDAYLSEALDEPISPPTRQETIRTMIRKTSKAQSGPGSPVITSPFLHKRQVPMPQTKAVRRRLFMQVFLSCLIMFTEGFYATQLFPYGPGMTETLRGTARDLGTCTGLLFTAQSCGMLLTAYFWANISNRYGRRICLLIGLSSNLIVSTLMAVSTDYWVTIGLRLFSGIMNSNLSIMRTALRESYKHEEADDTQAFSTLSVAFGAASVCGPSYGGLVYGALLPAAGSWQQPWSLAMLSCTMLYAACLVVTAVYMPETAFLDKKPGAKFNGALKEPARTVPRPSLLRDWSFILLLLMGGGHSYVFTGWEIVYPLLARVPASNGGEEWTTASIGITFLMGSVWLMVYSLLVYPRIAKKLKVIRIWIYSAFAPLLAFVVFPYAMTYLCKSGTDGQSFIVVLLNYGSQAFVSMLFGSGFISIQLLLNTYVSSMPDSADLLALANSLLVSTQAFVRAVSPIVTGTLFTLGLQAEESSMKAYISRALPFDSLACIGFVTCIFCALAFERRQASFNSPGQVVIS
mmetsp:Transcript_29675/g.84903  ORF Transcript_29675/g.84903 Transcript_29675/m.84903 type:complete len:546 (+) Transcript_29675:131-1768(+)